MSALAGHPFLADVVSAFRRTVPLSSPAPAILRVVGHNTAELWMPVTIGTRFGSYEILSLLGAGGMGEVYRARDAKLGRTIAIKVLPDALASDPDRLARFEREAKVLASLNHPHIAALYGFEEAEGRHLLVMELVEGETLAERLMRGPMTVDEALESRSRSPMRSSPRTRRASSIAISSQPTSSSRRMVASRSSTSVLPAAEKDQPASSVNVDELSDAECAGDTSRGHPGHGGLHVAGAGQGRVGRPPQRHVLVRRRPLRDVDGPSRVSRRDGRGNDGRRADEGAGLQRAAA